MCCVASLKRLGGSYHFAAIHKTAALDLAASYHVAANILATLTSEEASRSHSNNHIANDSFGQGQFKTRISPEIPWTTFCWC